VIAAAEGDRVVARSGASVAAFTRWSRDSGASARTASRGANKFQRARASPRRATTRIPCWSAAPSRP